MFMIHQLSFYLHVAIGSCALLIFWIPVFTRKGNLDHKRYGRFFAMAMYVVSVSGFTMASLDLLNPIATHAGGEALSPDVAEQLSRDVRAFALFLFSLSVLVFTNTRQGWLSILHKDNRRPLRSPIHTALCVGLIAVGVVLFIYGMRTGSMLFMIFAVLEVVSGVNCLRYNFKEELKPKEWWTQHLSNQIGSGIGAYTAFMVFGGRRIFEVIFADPSADITIVLWVAPGVIGSIAITYLSRRYENKFNTEWAIKHATIRTEMFN